VFVGSFFYISTFWRLTLSLFDEFLLTIDGPGRAVGAIFVRVVLTAECRPTRNKLTKKGYLKHISS